MLHLLFLTFTWPATAAWRLLMILSDHSSRMNMTHLQQPKINRWREEKEFFGGISQLPFHSPIPNDDWRGYTSPSYIHSLWWIWKWNVFIFITVATWNIWTIMPATISQAVSHPSIHPLTRPSPFTCNLQNELPPTTANPYHLRTDSWC